MRRNPMAVHYSAKRPDWATPPELFAKWDAEFGFTLDAAALPHNAKCARYFTPDDDGLAQSWGTETVWVNPPYGAQIAAWMRKAWQSSKYGATVVLLVPARTDTRWWHDHAMKGEIRFLRGRIKFVGATASAPFPCALVIFRAQPQERAA
jgi:phage N-6-adenine-methyltransferase